MSDLVENPEDRFSQNEAHIIEPDLRALIKPATIDLVSDLLIVYYDKDLDVIVCCRSEKVNKGKSIKV